LYGIELREWHRASHKDGIGRTNVALSFSNSIELREFDIEFRVSQKAASSFAKDIDHREPHRASQRQHGEHTVTPTRERTSQLRIFTQILTFT
jgi:hypothetical protein